MGAIVSNLENALRRALSKGDMADPDFRRKVYTAAANAMERSMADSASDDATKAARRKNLASTISALEAELRAAPPRITPVKREFERDSAGAPPVSNGMRSAEPRLRVQPRDDDDAVAPVADPRPARSARPRTRIYSKLLSVVILIAFIVIGTIFVITTGAFQSVQERDTSVPNPPLQLEDENSDAGTARAPALASDGTSDERARQEGWVTLFSPSDPTTLGLSGGAEVAIQSDPFGDFARVLTPTEGAQVQVDVPVGTLLDLQGFPVQVNIVARSDEGQPTEFSVTCDLGALGDCGRRRFNVGQAPAEYLFRLNLPSVDEINEAGRINIRTDINGNERPLNLLAVRIRRAGGN